MLATPNTDNNGNNYPIPVISNITTTSVTISSCVDAGDPTCAAGASNEDFALLVVDGDKSACVDNIEAGATTISTDGADTAFTFGS